MGHARLHVARLNSLLHLFLHEHAKLLNGQFGSLQRCHGCHEHPGMAFPRTYQNISVTKSLTFWCGKNPIMVGGILYYIYILINLINGKQVSNSLVIEPEVALAKKLFSSEVETSVFQLP